MARQRGFWAEIQRDRAVRQKRAEQAQRAALQEGRRLKREADQQRRAQERAAAADERERRVLYVEARKTEAAEMTDALASRVAELDSVLVDGIARSTDLTFAALKRKPKVRPFDSQGLDAPLPTPTWAEPAKPGLVGRALGGAARHERAMARAWQDYDQQLAQHSAEVIERKRQLDALREAYDSAVAQEKAAVEQHNSGVADFERKVRAGESQEVAQFFTLVLDSSLYPEGFPHRTTLIYETEPKHLAIDYELPPQDLVPATRGHRYVQTRDEIDALPRPVKEIKERYANLIAQVALRVLHEVFRADDFGLLGSVTFNGRVAAIDKATGQPIRPHLITLRTSRDAFGSLVLSDLDPVRCLRHLNALVSPHPYDLEAVKPVVDIDAMLERYKFVEGMDAVATLDSRPDLLEMTPTEFEHFTRQLFEAMGMKSWVTQASKDDGVDAVVTNEDPVFGGLCIIQAKRYRGPVGVEAVRALAGVMEDKHATKGILVTTSWVTHDGHAFANRHERIQVVDGENLKFLCLEHLGLDVLISLPKAPPKRRQ